MYYPQELARPRARPPLYGNYINETETLRRLRPFNRCSKQRRFLAPILTYLKGYCSFSSVHGIRFLTDTKLRNFERFIWLLILLVTFISATVVYIDLSELYSSARVHTTIENSMLPVFRVAFPSVGICPRSRINWPKMEHEVPEHFLGANATHEKKDLFIKFFTAVSAVHFGNMKGLTKFFENETLAATVHQLDHFDVPLVLNYMNHECSDIFVNCNWRGKSHNCCDIFELQNTELGLCWLFNSVVSKKMQEREKADKFYPLRNAQAGPGSGLEVFMQFNRTLDNPDIRGVYVMIKHPEQWNENARMLQPNSQNRIGISPRYTGSDVRTRALPPEERRCLFPDETKHLYYKNLPGFLYWRGNCRSKCHQEYAINLCNCSPSLFFPHGEDNFTVCKPSDYHCLFNHKSTFSAERVPLEQEYVDDVFKDSMTCDCLISCSQLVYDVIISSNALKLQEPGMNLVNMYLDVFFQSSWFITYQMHMRFTFVELLASFGGIAGLFLGASLLSAFEFVYYFTIGLYLYLFRGNRKSYDRQQQQLIPTPTQPITIHFRRKIAPNKKKILY